LRIPHCRSEFAQRLHAHNILGKQEKVMAREIRQRTSKHIKMRLLLLETRAHEFATLCRGALIDHKRRHVDLSSLQLRVKLDRLEHWQAESALKVFSSIDESRLKSRTTCAKPSAFS
jgi:hypothetical protein